MPTLSLILARAANGVIGRGNDLPWHLPEDLAYFKRVTLGKPVIMGRKTWDSIFARLGTGLPGRRNIVVTRDPAWQASGAERAHSLNEAIALAGDVPEVMLIGGAQLFNQALDQAQRIYLTEIDQTFEGDTFFPLLPAYAWREVARDSHLKEGASPFKFHFVVYEKN